MFSRKSSSGGGRKTPVPETVPETHVYQPEPEPELVATPSQEQKELLLNAAGAVFDNQNKELVKRIAEMKQKRVEITSTIETEEQEVAQYDAQQELLQARLDEVKESLMKKRALVSEYDKVIGETESAYSKILESSMSLLSVLDKDTLEVHKARSRHASVSGETDIM